MYCIIAVGLISDRFDHMKFGLPISMQAIEHKITLSLYDG